MNSAKIYFSSFCDKWLSNDKYKHWIVKGEDKLSCNVKYVMFKNHNKSLGLPSVKSGNPNRNRYNTVTFYPEEVKSNAQYYLINFISTSFYCEW